VYNFPDSDHTDIDSDDDLQAALTRELSPRESARPDLSRLPDAISGGLPLFGEGDRIIIERRAIVLPGKPYLDTRTYKVKRVDPISGEIKLFDEQAGNNAYDNWKVGLLHGQVYKFAVAGVTSSKRKRGRPRKNPVAPPPSPSDTPETPKRGRGRPKGSKNRGREVIAAEKAAKKVARAAKRAGK
jgi:hypothetical protein